MKKSNKFLISLLSIVVAAVLFSVPISLITEEMASASNNKNIIAQASNNSVSEYDDYFFTVIEDEPVALASTPFDNTSKEIVGTIVGVSLISMLGIAYVSWYTMVRRNICNYSRVLPDYEIKSLVPAKSFLHPIELSAAEYEVQYRAAKKYF